MTWFWIRTSWTSGMISTSPTSRFSQRIRRRILSIIDFPGKKLKKEPHRSIIPSKADSPSSVRVIRVLGLGELVRPDADDLRDAIQENLFDSGIKLQDPGFEVGETFEVETVDLEQDDDF